MSKKRKKSIITPLTNKCYLCGSLHDIETHHVMYEWNYTKLSKRYRLTVPLCHSCHEKVHADAETDLKLKRVAQVAFDMEYPDKSFVEVFGRNYLQT